MTKWTQSCQMSFEKSQGDPGRQEYSLAGRWMYILLDNTRCMRIRMGFHPKHTNNELTDKQYSLDSHISLLCTAFPM